MTRIRLPPELERQINNELDSEETILWTGQPLPRLFARQGIGPMLFGIPFTAFAVFWMWGASGFGHPTHMPGPFVLFPLFGLPFLLTGLGVLLSPLWQWRRATRTGYAVTKKRVLILERGWTGSTTVRNLVPEQIGDRARTQRADGTGDLTFPRTASVISSNYGNPSNMGYGRRGYNISMAGFYSIPDVKEVDDLIRQTFGQ